MKKNRTYSGLEIAVIGIACRFPGAAGWRPYWNNIETGTETITRFTDEELLSAGVSPERLTGADFVRAGGVMPGKDLFDYSFFDYTHAEAKLMNPAHRVFHQLAWEALEDAGCNPEQIKGPVGVFAGAGDDFNWQIYSALKNGETGDVDEFMLDLLKSKDHLTTLLSYKLNFTGPSSNINTACSTSLVAINMASRSLLLGDAEVALAGGISIHTHKQKGYNYKEGMIYSPDGHCRVFDKDARGTVASEGAGLVVLKPLNDAIADGDHIYAIIKGSAINNDGSNKAGYTAPSVVGQAECIKKAFAFAKVDPATISYVETHGTGTHLGDPIEIAALNMAFNSTGKSTCAIGSSKSLMGHTDSAAGVAGFIKAVLSLYFKKIPPSLHFHTPNPEIDFEGGPFYVNTKLQHWQNNGHPLRAGVSSFGIGGTNAHAVLEEAPAAETAAAGKKHHILTLSARTEGALERYIGSLYNHITQNPGLNPADLAYTLQTGRRHFTVRKQVMYADTEELTVLLAPEKAREGMIKNSTRQKQLVFMFPGQGTQYHHMCSGLYGGHPVFTLVMDEGFEQIRKLTGEDMKAILFPQEEGNDAINETRYTQPLIFLTEYALAQTLMYLGLKPSCMIGHSIGEYVAAVLSGVMSLNDALRLVIKRGAIMSKVAAGAMVSAVMEEADAAQYLMAGVSIAAVNGPGQVVFSGSFEVMDALKEQLTHNAVTHTTLLTPHAFHSSMLDSILEEFGNEAAQIQFGEMSIPFISNLTGAFIKAGEAASAGYWVQHMRETIKFSQGIQTLLSSKQDYLYIEAGPGHVLSSLLRQHAAAVKPAAVNMVRNVNEAVDDMEFFTGRLGQLWAAGAPIDWQQYYIGEKRSKLSLPVYQFEPVKFITEINLFEHINSLPGKTASAAVNNQPGTTSHVVQNGSMTREQLLPEPTTAVPETDVENITLSIAEGEPLEQVWVKMERPELSTPYVAPATSTEVRLARLLEDMFGIDRLGVEDNFLELGGDSLKGMVVIKKIKEEFSISIPVKDFFGKQNLREIAQEIDKVLPGEAAEESARPVKTTISI